LRLCWYRVWGGGGGCPIGRMPGLRRARDPLPDEYCEVGVRPDILPPSIAKRRLRPFALAASSVHACTRKGVHTRVHVYVHTHTCTLRAHLRVHTRAGARAC
jgi:hypothetical protein